eukprot:985873-Ditylum_brightwellii.AAC.1
MTGLQCLGGDKIGDGDAFDGVKIQKMVNSRSLKGEEQTNLTSDLNLHEDVDGEHFNETQESFTIASLDPKLVQDEIDDTVASLQKRVLEELTDAYDDSGISEYIDGAINSAKSVAESIFIAFEGFRSTLENEGAEAASFYTFVDEYISSEAEEFFSKFTGICDTGGSSRRFLKNDNGDKHRHQLILAQGAKKQQSFLNLLGNAMQIHNINFSPTTVPSSQSSKSFQPSSVLSPEPSSIPSSIPISSSNDQCAAPPTSTDLGASCVTMGSAPLAGNFFSKKRGLYLEAGLGMGIENGILLSTGEFKQTVAAGVGVSLGQTYTPITCLPNEYRTSSNT